eukprot:580736-Pleurochrysis_carterae.AAC.1
MSALATVEICGAVEAFDLMLHEEQVRRPQDGQHAGQGAGLGSGRLYGSKPSGMCSGGVRAEAAVAAAAQAFHYRLSLRDAGGS